MKRKSETEIIGKSKVTKVIHEKEVVTCTICQELIDHVDISQSRVKLKCSHEYHSKCIQCYMAYGNPSCPICRKVIDPSDIDSTLSVTDCREVIKHNIAQIWRKLCGRLRILTGSTCEALLLNIMYNMKIQKYPDKVETWYKILCLDMLALTRDVLTTQFKLSLDIHNIIIEHAIHNLVQCNSVDATAVKIYDLMREMYSNNVKRQLGTYSVKALAYWAITQYFKDDLLRCDVLAIYPTVDTICRILIRRMERTGYNEPYILESSNTITDTIERFCAIESKFELLSGEGSTSDDLIKLRVDVVQLNLDSKDVQFDVLTNTGVHRTALTRPIRQQYHTMLSPTVRFWSSMLLE
jgi:hypothetical protein